MSSADACAKAAQGLKGKLVEVLQVYRDCLCECYRCTGRERVGTSSGWDRGIWVWPRKWKRCRSTGTAYVGTCLVVFGVWGFGFGNQAHCLSFSPACAGSELAPMRLMCPMTASSAPPRLSLFCRV